MTPSREPTGVRVLLDVMGGDLGLRANLEGALRALPELEGELILIGDEPAIREKLRRRRFRPLLEALDHDSQDARCRVRLVHAAETIVMADSIRAVRNKPGAPINLGCRMAAEDWKAGRPSAFVSAGHSGAMMAAALLAMGRLPNVERPGIAVKLPSLNPDGCVLIDIGANVDCKPEHLRDFAVMGAIFAQVERGSPSRPRVGVLSNGEERVKGIELTRKAVELIERHPAFSPTDPERLGDFVGYSEGKDLFRGGTDVVVCDGFVGNLVLKSVEGVGFAVIEILKKEAKSNPLASLGFLLAAGVFRRLKRRLDSAEYGAAPLLGVEGYAFICHGRSDGKAIKNALLRTQSALKCRLVERLKERLD